MCSNMNKQTNNKIKIKTVKAVPKSSRKIEETRGKIDAPNTHIIDRSLLYLHTCM
jgi:hypothetical protein